MKFSANKLNQFTHTGKYTLHTEYSGWTPLAFCALSAPGSEIHQTDEMHSLLLRSGKFLTFICSCSPLAACWTLDNCTNIKSSDCVSCNLYCDVQAQVGMKTNWFDHAVKERKYIQSLLFTARPTLMYMQTYHHNDRLQLFGSSHLPYATQCTDGFVAVH